MNATLLLKFVLVHLLCDFVFQTKKIVLHKQQHGAASIWLYLHCLLHGAGVWLISGNLQWWWLLPAVSVSHFFIDWWKTKRPSSLAAFLADQAAHLLILFILYIYIRYTRADIENIFIKYWNNPKIWAIACGYIAVLLPTSFVLQLATKNWRNDLLKHDAPILKDSLKDAGKWIGMLERSIILTCILSGRYEGIGILIGAKSILRFNDLKGEHSQRQTEYVLIGTLLSFIIAIVIGILLARFL